jgi:hypothetical protein
MGQQGWSTHVTDVARVEGREDGWRVRVNIFQSADNDLRIDNKMEFQPETRPRACSPDGGIDSYIAR